MDIAERHNLQQGDLCEIRVIPKFGDEYAAYAVYKFTVASTGDLFFDRGPLTSPLTLSPERIRSVQKVTPEYVVKQFSVGQRVLINKYAGTYRATVVKIGRTRLHLTFTTRGGKAKQIDVPAWQVERVVSLIGAR